MTSPARIDLHTHSSVSDGTDSPEELVAAAARSGLDVVALTDHDTWDGIDRAGRAAPAGLEVVVGIEISCGSAGRAVHLLGYGGDRTDPALLAELDRIRTARRTRVPDMLAKLAALGLPLSTEAVTAAAHGTPSIGRPHLADAMVAAGYVADRDEAFADYLAEGGPAYVDRYAPEVSAAIGLVRDAGAVPVLAHPWGRESREVLGEERLLDLLEVGLAGWEADHPEHSPAEGAALHRLARRAGALATGSSDYHGTGKRNNALGCRTTDPQVYARLRELMG